MRAAFQGCGRRLKRHKIAPPSIGFCVLLLLIYILSGSDISCSAQASGSKPPLLTLRYIDTDLRRDDVMYDSHLVLCSNGLFHLMRKTQVFPEHEARINLYEGQLSEAQLAEVRALLTSKDLEALPPFDISSTMSFVSVGNFAMEEVFASIYRNDKIHEVGYVVWHGPKPEDSIEGARREVQDQQSRAKTILAPLLRWQKSLQGTLINNPNAMPVECSA
jgi:hypothetical protein